MKILFLNHAPNVAHMRDMEEIFRFIHHGALIETNLAETEVLWVGPWMRRDHEPIDWLLIERIIKFKPDALHIYGWSMRPDDNIKANYVSLQTLYVIRKLFNLKIICLLMDQAYKNFHVSDNLVRFVDFALVHEHRSVFDGFTQFPEKHIEIPTIYSVKFVSSPDKPRTIDIGFIGGVGGRYPIEREKGIAAMKSAGLDVVNPGGRSVGQRKISNDEYLRFLKEAKIIINWSRHMSGNWFQAKGRIFEATLSGALLLSEECEAVNEFFTPYKDYIPFSDPRELVEKAKFYLKNESARLKISKSGHLVAKKYLADTVWANILSTLNEKTYFNEKEALEGLRLNSSKNELRVVKFVQEKMKSYPEYDAIIVNELRGMLIASYFSPKRQMKWLKSRILWAWPQVLRTLPWRLLRVAFPASVTRESVRSFVRDKLRLLRSYF